MECLVSCVTPIIKLTPVLLCCALGSDRARYEFAKEAVELRKHGVARGQGAEETVVLAFGGGNTNGSAVHVARKMRKRPLWKVNA